MGEVCVWTEDWDGIHQTECGQAFVLTEGPLKETGFKFCCYCGRPLVDGGVEILDEDLEET